MGLYGLEMEVVHAEANSDRFPVLQYHLEPAPKLRMVKEVAAALGREATFWHRSAGEAGSRYLYCDVPALPDSSGVQVIAAKLKEAIALSTVLTKST